MRWCTNWWSSPGFVYPGLLIFLCFAGFFKSGAEGIRTPDLRRAKAALSQLSYGPGTKLSVRPAPPLFNAPAKSRNGGLAGGRIRSVGVRLPEEDENP